MKIIKGLIALNNQMVEVLRAPRSRGLVEFKEFSY